MDIGYAMIQMTMSCFRTRAIVALETTVGSRFAGPTGVKNTRATGKPARNVLEALS